MMNIFQSNEIKAIFRLNVFSSKLEVLTELLTLIRPVVLGNV